MAQRSDRNVTKKSPCATYSTVAGTEACFRSNDTAPPFLNVFLLPFL
ncbi:predicted protein [Botrytis cinerea T4]|uniref:Uncharacterized protein n=1 Tax=Botryotinia fuckeliana (strain T4) TaxID=999810 RepID=G2YES5_BOTF4|nr:predicted protein [Botrytis cinerea T4]